MQVISSNVQQAAQPADTSLSQPSTGVRFASSNVTSKRTASFAKQPTITEHKATDPSEPPASYSLRNRASRMEGPKRAATRDSMRSSKRARSVTNYAALAGEVS
jgi:hypothetical protein